MTERNMTKRRQKPLKEKRTEEQTPQSSPELLRTYKREVISLPKLTQGEAIARIQICQGLVGDTSEVWVPALPHPEGLLPGLWPSQSHQAQISDLLPSFLWDHPPHKSWKSLGHQATGGANIRHPSTQGDKGSPAFLHSLFPLQMDSTHHPGIRNQCALLLASHHCETSETPLPCMKIQSLLPLKVLGGCVQA